MESQSVAAKEVVELLDQHQQRLVLAESCTAGLVAAEISMVVGVSEFFCGSAVTYRDATKRSWLDVDGKCIAEQTAVCRDVAEQMVRGVLRKTPEATIAASITGHLGPDVPPDFDGLVFVGVGQQSASEIQAVEVTKHQLQESGRTARQIEAVGIVFDRLKQRLRGIRADHEPG